jgi:hypothetical protein
MYIEVNKSVRVLSWLVFILVVAACTPILPTPEPTQSVLPTPAAVQSPLVTPAAATVPAEPTPQHGTAAVKGALLTSKGFSSIPGTQFYLKPVGTEGQSGEPWTLVLVGPETDKGDIVGQSGSQGEFFINDVPPGKYYLIVWAPYNWIPIETDTDGQRPQEFELKAGEIADLGSLVLSWP